jgi:hypothetical protein
MSESVPTLFASMSLVRRIEAAEARAIEAIVSVGGATTWLAHAGGGVALFRAHGSPFNKVNRVILAAWARRAKAIERVECARKKRPRDVEKHASAPTLQ